MPSTVTNDANSVLPLLFAAHPDIIPNYRRMAALDSAGRTHSALEHKFRIWRQEGRKILASNGNDELATNKANGGSKKVAPPNGDAGARDTADPASKKRPAPTDDATSKATDMNGGTPVKKARGPKKGMAHKVHRPAPKPHESEEEMTSSMDEEVEDLKREKKHMEKMRLKK